MGKSKQFAIIGLGRFGSSVASTLVKAGYDVLVVDIDEERVQKFADEVTHVVKADTTDEAVVKSLGLRNFDVVVVAIGHYIQASVLTTLLLKEAGVKYIVAKADNALHGKMLEKIGADRVVYPERDMGVRIAHNLTSINVIDFIELSSELGIVEIAIPRSLIGKSLAEANIRSLYGVNVIAIKRDGKLNISPIPSERFIASDNLIVIGDIQGLAKVENLD